MIFLFPRWDMLVPWRVGSYLGSYGKYWHNISMIKSNNPIGSCGMICWPKFSCFVHGKWRQTYHTLIPVENWKLMATTHRYTAKNWLDQQQTPRLCSRYVARCAVARMKKLTRHIDDDEGRPKLMRWFENRVQATKCSTISYESLAICSIGVEVFTDIFFWPRFHGKCRSDLNVL